MPVDKTKVENILTNDDFHVNELRDLVEERELNVAKSKKDEMADALLADTWTEEQFRDLKARFRRLQRERSPLGFYVVRVDDYPDFTENPKHEELKERLKANAAIREGGQLKQDGFDVHKAEETQVSGIYWTQTRSYSLNALDQLTERERTYDIGFRFDLENDLLHIRADNYGKRGEVLNEFKSAGVGIDRIGPQNKQSSTANEIIGGFEQDLREGLEEAKQQQEIADFSEGETRELLEVRTVEIKLTDGELSTANLKGYQHIFENDVVKKLTGDKNGRIIHLKGNFEYAGEDFDFHVGLPEDMGRIRIEKKGGPTENGVMKLEKAFDFLFEHFSEHFIESEDVS